MERNSTPQSGPKRPTNGGQASTSQFPVIGIGATAESLRALQAFFSHTPPDTGMAFVVIAHPAPERWNELSALLQSTAALPVMEVQDAADLAPNTIYLIPPRRQLSLESGQIRLLPSDDSPKERAPIKQLFHMLAETYRERAGAVVLCGVDSDGVSGLAHVKECGGVTIAQDPDEAEFDGTPHPAIATVLVDLVLQSTAMPQALINYWQDDQTLAFPITTASDGDSLREIFSVLRARTGHDFSEYQRTTMLRRIDRRMQVMGANGLPDYVAILHERAEEGHALLGDLLISVTNFFRDPEVWQAMEAFVPRLFIGKTASDQVRVWVAGCATGEEAYTIAMILLDYARTLEDPPAIHVFASDIDEQAIVRARQGVYPTTIAADVPPAYLERFFILEHDHYRVMPQLRETVLFAVHNLLHDPPFSRLDLVTCRNVLIYLNRSAQEQVLLLFHFSMRDEGCLLLGKSETTDSVPQHFMPLSTHQRLYRRCSLLPTILAGLPDPLLDEPSLRPLQTNDRDTNSTRSFAELSVQMLAQYGPPTILVNDTYDVLHVDRGAGRFLQFGEGRLSRNLLSLVHTSVRASLRAALHAATQTGARSGASGVLTDINGTPYVVTIVVQPITEPEWARGSLLVMLNDMQGIRESNPPRTSDGEPLMHELEAEVQRLREQLRTATEQHKTMVEEYKAINEELHVLNAEQRAMTEKVETSKEEVQSTNEELLTVNQEFKHKITEVSQSNDDLQNLMDATTIGTLFADRLLRITRYTPAALAIFNLIPADLNRPLAHITHKLVGDGVMQHIEGVLTTGEPFEREVRTTDERWYLARFQPYRTHDNRIEGVVLTFVDITEHKQAEDRLHEAANYQAFILGAFGAADFDADTRTGAVRCGRELNRLYGFPEDMALTLADVRARYHPDDLQHMLAVWTDAQKHKQRRWEREYRVVIPEGQEGAGIRWVMARGEVVFSADGEPERVRGAAIDITDRKLAEEQLQTVEANQRAILDSAHQSIMLIAPDYTLQLFNRYAAEAVATVFGADMQVGQSFLQYVTPDEYDSFVTHFQQALSGQEINVEKPITGLTSTDWWEFFYYPITLPTGDVRGVTFTSRNITKRKQVEEVLRESEAHQAFLLQLSDALRPLSNALAIQAASSRIIGEALGADRAYFGDVYEDEELAFLRPGYIRHGERSIAGRYRLADFREIIDGLRNGQPFIIPDVQQSAQLSEHTKQVYASIKLASYAAVPLVKDEKLVWTLNVTSESPREWTKREIALLWEVAERTWATVERARAEEALRQNEEDLRLITDNLPVLIAYHDQDERYRFINAAFPSFFGVPREQILGRTIREQVGDRVYARLQPGIKQALAGQTVRFEDMEPNKHGPGLHSWTEENYIPRFTPDGSVEGFFVLAMDITERKWAEEELRKSEARSRAITNLVPALLWQIDPTGQQIDWNPRWLEYTGQTLEQTNYGGWFEHIHPEDRLNTTRVFEEASHEQRELEVQHRIRRYDGEYRWFLVRQLPIKDENGTLIQWFGAAIDIHEQRLALDALRESVQYLDLVLDAAEAADYELDLRANRVRHSERLNAMYQFPPEKAPTLIAFQERYHPDDLELMRSVVSHARPNNAHFERDFRIVLPDQSIRWVHSRGIVQFDQQNNPISVRGAAINITERKRAEEALRQSQERLQKAMSIETVGVIFFDLDGVIHDANPAFVRMSGYSRAALRGGNIRWDMVTPPEFMEATRRSQEELRTNGENTPYEKQYTRPDGSRWWGLFAGKRLNPTECVEFVLDITARKQAEAALQHANEELEARVAERTATLVAVNASLEQEIAERRELQAQRDALMQRIITAQEDERQRVARDLHDSLGQFLTALTIRLTTTENMPGIQPKVQESLRGLRALAAQIDAEVDRLTMQLRPPTLDDIGLIDALVSYTREWTATSSIRADVVPLHIGTARMPPVVEATVYRIVQEALTNVLKHAQASEVSVIVERRSNVLRVIIEDNGQGFDPAALDRQGKGGRQVGLVGMAERATLAGGEVHIESDYGMGTTIYLHIPLGDQVNAETPGDTQ